MTNKLFHVQDSDRPIYVMAPDWQDAVKLWRELVELENGAPEEGERPYDPSGVALIADHDEVFVAPYDDRLL